MSIIELIQKIQNVAANAGGIFNILPKIFTLFNSFLGKPMLFKTIFELIDSDTPNKSIISDSSQDFVSSSPMTEKYSEINKEKKHQLKISDLLNDKYPFVLALL